MKAILIIGLSCLTGSLLISAVMLFAGQSQTRAWNNEMARINAEQKASFEGRSL
jgi:hypothetical protein